MKISIDAYNIALTHGTGVATYGRNLARAVGNMGHDISVLFGTKASHSKVPILNEIAIADDINTGDNNTKFHMFGIVAQAAQGVITSRKAHEIIVSGQVIMPKGLQLDDAQFWNTQRLYSSANGAFRATGAFTNVSLPKTDIAHWTYPLPLKIPGACNIYTLHDLVPLRLPYTTADTKRAYYKLCKKVARDADHILTVSECSRRDIINILNVDEARVTNLYQSSNIASVVTDVPRKEMVRRIRGLINVSDREYYLFFGAIEPKKNVARIIESYLASGSSFPLVIVGAPGWGSDSDIKLLKSFKSFDKLNRIIWLNYLPRDMLAMMIMCARATLFPSLYEGFGLPVLESMELGTPVITSNISSIPEVAGDAALLVDPYDVQSITRAIITLDNDADLRADMQQKGSLQAGKFSTDVYQNRLIEFYKQF